MEAVGTELAAEVDFTFDATKGNQQMASGERGAKSLERHIEVLAATPMPQGGSLLAKVARTGQYFLHRMHIVEDRVHPDNGRARDVADGVVWSKEVRLAAGSPVVLDKVVTVWTSRDAGYPHGLLPEKRDPEGCAVEPEKEAAVIAEIERLSASHAGEANALGVDALRARHIADLERKWEHCDVEIEGDPAAQQGIRYSMFQLLGTYGGKDPWLNIGAKGLTGEVYQGRTFWDTESYCFPFYLLTQPETAEKLLEFRYRGLDAARARARELNYPGAVYPFTTLDGTEDTEVNELSLTEVHINAIIPYVIFLHAKVTGGDDYLFEKGIDMLVEQCRFWTARAAWIPYRNGYGINAVTGPDEWAAIANNNFYTNSLAAWVLENTADTLERIKAGAPEQLDEAACRLNLREDEPAVWRKIAAGMLLPREETLGIYPQDDSFLSRDPMLRTDLDPERDIPLDRKWAPERIARVRLAKQPDVLLLMFLLRDRFSRKDKEANYRFYEPLTAHGSSLSPAVHSILACDIGDRRQAYDYYLWASRLDLDNRNRNTEEGLHISSLAATWLNVVCGFGGLDYTSGILRLSPDLPDAWESLAFRLRYRGSTLRFTVFPDRVTCTVLDGPPVTLELCGKPVTAGTASVPLPARKAAP